MQDSMMMAEVGGIANVRGSRIATPFAPPSPGSTPMITPSTMPIIMSSMLNGVSTTLNPWNNAESSTNVFLRAWRSRASLMRSVAEERERIELALEEGHLEPDLEHHEQARAHAESDERAAQGRVATQPHHEHRDVDGRRDIESDELHREHVDDRRDEHRQHELERTPGHEELAAHDGPGDRADQDDRARDAQEKA